MRNKLIELICEGTQKTEICTTETYMDCETCRGDCGYCTILADHLLENGATIPQWIPVSESLPSHEDDVLVCFSDGYVCGAYYDVITEEWIKEDGMPVYERYPLTHWMPLPEPPKGE